MIPESRNWMLMVRDPMSGVAGSPPAPSIIQLDIHATSRGVSRNDRTRFPDEKQEREADQK